MANELVRIHDAGVTSALRRLRDGLPLGGSMKPAFENMGRALKTGALLRFRSGVGPDGAGWKKSFRAEHEGGQTLSLSRRLRNSITYIATPTGVTIGTNVIYAAIHQFGGVIRAKKGPFLAIPLTPAARANGTQGMNPLHMIQSLKGQFLLADAHGKPQFLLRSKVTMPARPFLGASESDRSELLAVAGRFLQERWT